MLKMEKNMTRTKKAVLLNITNNTTMDCITRDYKVICGIVRKHDTTKKLSGKMVDTKIVKNVQVMSSKVKS